MCCISANLLTPGTLILQVMAVVLIQFGRHRAVRSTGVLFIYWILQFVSAVLALQTHARAVAAGVTNHPIIVFDFLKIYLLVSPSEGCEVLWRSYAYVVYVCLLVSFKDYVFVFHKNRLLNSCCCRCCIKVFHLLPNACYYYVRFVSLVK